MATELSVVNACLAIMGEAPLNSLVEDHAFRAAAQEALLDARASILSRGWWFNKETLTVEVSPADNRMYVPGDVTSVLPPASQTNIVLRGRVLYDVDRGSSLFPAGSSVKLVVTRLLALEDIPPSVSDLIVATTVLTFQMNFDGDQTKARNVLARVQQLQQLATAEHIRQSHTNLVATSPGLARIRRNYPRY